MERSNSHWTIWSVDKEAFLQNAIKVKMVIQLWSVEEQRLSLWFGVCLLTFLKAGINTFSTTSLKEAIKVREIAPDATIFLMNAVYDFEK